MRESVIYQEIEAQGLQQGLQQERSLILKLLSRRIGAIPPEVLPQIEALPLAQLEALAEALLDFSASSDLLAWLQAHQ